VLATHGANTMSSILRRQRKFSHSSSPAGIKSPMRSGNILARHHICAATSTIRRNILNIRDAYNKHFIIEYNNIKI